MGLNGTDVLLLVNTGTEVAPVYEVVGSQRDVSFEDTTAVIDFSSKDKKTTRVGAGRQASTLSLDGLYVPTDAAYLALKAARKAGELILVRKQESGVDIEEAYALITSISSTFPDQGDSTISISMQIDDDWVEVGS